MKYTAIDLIEMRRLITTIDQAKRYRQGGLGDPMSREDVERELVTYIGTGVTVASLRDAERNEAEKAAEHARMMLQRNRDEAARQVWLWAMGGDSTVPRMWALEDGRKLREQREAQLYQYPRPEPAKPRRFLRR